MKRTTLYLCSVLFFSFVMIAVLAVKVRECGVKNGYLHEHIQMLYQRDALDGDWKQR